MGAGLSLRGVRHRRGGRDVLRIEALDITAGERLAVLGPNGSGKTTLLRLLAGIATPTAGSVLVDGVPTRAGGVALRRRIAYATQQPGLLTTTARRNVELPLRWRRLPRDRRRAAAEESLQRLGVADLAERPARALSGGEAQRVSLARALALEPALLLLDEPAAGLDADSRAAFLADAERALDDRATTVVHVSHRAEEAMRLADRIAILVDGTIRQLAAPDALLRHPADATVARLVGYENLLDANVDADGAVLIAGLPTGLSCNDGARRVTVAAWAAAVRLGPGGGDGIPATVTRVSLGPGRWELSLEGPVPLRAHLPLDTPTPSPHDDLSVQLDPALCALVPAQPTESPALP